MRIIKFRAWDKEFEMMFYSNSSDDPLNVTGERIHHLCGCKKPEGHLNHFFFEKAPIMQFTGLHDKHGKEIWEGDIVKTVLFDDELIGMVEYADQWGTFYLGITNKHGSRIALHTVFEWLYKEESDDIVAEVIGNIYENPELLKDTP